MPEPSSTPELLDKLLRARAPSGYEGPASSIWRTEAAFARLSADGIGSTVATIGDEGASPLLAIVGHIDEIGLLVTHIDEKGFLYVTPVGGWDAQILIGQRVRVDTRDASVPGVIGRKAIHLLKEEQRKQAVELSGLHIDIGAADGDAAKEMVRIGDPVVIDAEPVAVEGGRLVSKSMDNRIGAYVALESLRRVNERGNLKGAMAGIASVQEEIGLNGAATSAFAVSPDVAIAIDVTHATDTPGTEEKETGSHPLGSGPVISRGSTLSPRVFELLCETAEKLDIEYTIEASGRRTGTDADVIHISKAGIPTGQVSVPLRYMHSPVEMVDLADLEATVELITGFAESLDASTELGR
jgi:putative aminopeptidase FrvX